MKIFTDLFYSRVYLVILTILSFFRAFIYVTLAYLLIPLVNEGFKNGMWKNEVILYTILFIFNLFLRLIQKKIYVLNEQKLENKILNQYVDHLLYTYVDRIEKESGKYLADVNDKWMQVKEALLNSLESVLFYPFIFFICFCLFIRINISICLLMYFLIMFATLFTFRKKTDLTFYQDKVNEARKDLLNYQKEAVENKEFIDLYSIHENISSQHNLLSLNVFKAECDYYKKMVISYFPALMNEYLPLIVFVIISLYYLSSGVIRYGELFSMLQIVNMLSLPMSKFVKNYIRCKNSTVIIDEIKKNKKDINISETFIKIQKLSFEQCSFTYSDKESNGGINSFSFEINDGDKVAIIGESGNGKSTLLKLMGGFLNWNSGTYIVNDIEHINDNNRFLLLNNLSYVDDQLYLLPENLYFNILGQSNSNVDDINRILNQFNIDDSLNKNIEQNGNNFSGGERLKINLARASHKNCNLHLFDEPTAHLDLKSKKYFYDYFSGLNGISILVTHDKENVKLCNKILYVHDKIVEELTFHDYEQKLEQERS